MLRYRILGRTGLRVANLALGTGNFGTGWGHGASEDDARAIYEAYRDAGGNFIDTASNYQFGESEQIVGRLIAADRDDVVVATKSTLAASPDGGLQQTGNSRRAMVQSVEASLRRLGTDRVDLLYVHFPDEVTPIDEIARALDDLVRSGKVLYTGLSNFPAWRVATAATLAEARGWSPVSAVQFEYSIVERTAERELIPMAEAFGLAALGWSPLGGGLLTGKYRAGATGRLQALGVVIQKEDDERKARTLDAVIGVAESLGVTPGQVALAWIIGRGVLPMLGPRTPQHLAENLGALAVALSPEHLARLEEASAIPLGFPHEMNAGSGTRASVAGGRAELVDFAGPRPR
jgi:aryl-alcohol dehydrogenase-like predicted oxidoreductase